MSGPTLKLPRNADELLRDFPLSEPDFEAQARAIQARLKGTPGGMVFDDWLRIPELVAEPGEPGLPSSVRNGAPKTNFAEIARKSVQKNDDSVELAKELLAATSKSRRPNAEMVERVRAAGRTAPTSTPLPAARESGAEEQRNSGVVARAASTATGAPSVSPANAKRGLMLGIAGGALALAASVALFVRSSGEDARTRAALAAQRAADAPAEAAGKAQAAPPQEPSDVVTPEALAAAPLPARERAKAVASKREGAPSPAAPVAMAAKPALSAAAPVKQEEVVLEEDSTSAEVTPAPEKAEPAPEPVLKPAEGNTGSMPLSPSAGALSTALSSVRSSAQACLAGQTDAVTAIVTFGADGRVLRVSAGGPNGPCIQAALSKAHVAPFAKESYSATTTVRPP